LAEAVPFCAPPLCLDRRILGIQPLRIDVFFQSLPVFPDEPGIRYDFVSLGLGSVAPDVFFLEHALKMRSFFQAVGYVLEDLVLRACVAATD